ncbi:MAG TPA: Mpo1-like protein [Paucimonas sp.]|nr:Mpo1-like protein [Paucimonas sp.]
MGQKSARQIDHLLDQYSENHRHPINEAIHCLCVPAIMFSAVGLIWAFHPLAALGLTVVSMIYYFTLSVPFAIGMLLMSGSFLWLLSMLPQQFIWQISLTIFVLAWIGQFIGHKIEGKKPSFFEDLRFLPIGPLFVLGVLYRRLHVIY